MRFVVLITMFLLATNIAGCTRKKSTANTTADGGGTTNSTPAENSLKLGVTISGTGGTELSLQEATAGELSITGDGTYYFPTSMTVDQNYQITELSIPKTIYCDLSTASGTFTLDLVVTIDCIPIVKPQLFSLQRTGFVFLVDFAELVIEVPEEASSTLSTYSIAPALPAGLSLNPNTGRITGTPSAPAAETTYTITQTHYDGTTSTTSIKITVASGFHVDSPEDAIDASAVDGICFVAAASGPSKCTLREAIREANSIPGEQVITFNSTLILTAGVIDVDQDLIITGVDEATATISGNNNSRIFQIDSLVKFTLNNLSLIEAFPQTGTPGGAISMTGGGSFYASHVTFSGNNCASNEDGCGFYANGLSDFLVEYSTFTNNTAVWDAAAWTQNANGVFDHIYVHDNQASDGGAGISITDGTVQIKNSIFSNNNGTNSAGAINITAGTGEILHSTFENNTVGSYGGAVVVSNTGALTIKNSTFKGNSSGDDAGAIVAMNSATLDIYNSAFVDNSSVQWAGAVWTIGTAVSRIYNSYFKNNTNTQGGGTVDHCNVDTVAGATSHHYYNVFDIADPGECILEPDSVGDTVLADLKLGNYGLNGGFVKAYLLQADSALIDAGANADCTLEDTYGVTRPVDGDSNGSATCDIGPVEYVP